MHYVIIFISLFAFHQSGCIESDEEFHWVKTPMGTVKGRAMLSGRHKRKFYAFTGIPYAKPPVDGLRFMDPQPVAKSSVEVDATKEPPECLQWDHLRMRGVVGEEDCLYLNVFTNRYIGLTESLGTTATVVFLHAGSWLAGGAANEFFTPDYLIENHVCVVTLNHRLGALGFLSLEDRDAPGNYGINDVITALEYVKRNIWHYGCMNDSITVMGTGAGGSLAHLLTLSPRSRGDSIKKDDQHTLIHSAISHSGTAYTPHAISRDAKEQAMKLSGNLGCAASNDSSTILNCLRNLDPKLIVGETATLFKWDEEPLPFGPVIDPWNEEKSFLPDEPHHIIKKGNFLQIPWMAGNNRDDGAFRVQDILKDQNLVRQLNDEWEKWGPVLLHLTKHSCKDPEYISKTIRDHYMKGAKFGEHSSKQFTEMMTDRFFVFPTERAMKDHCKHFIRERDLCYRYVLDYSGRKSYLDVLHATIGRTGDFGSTFGIANPRFQNTRDAHGWGVSFMDELLYLFPSPKLKLVYDQKFDSDGSTKVSTAMIMYWTNFMKGGDPTPEVDGFPDDMSPWGAWWEPFYYGHDFIFILDPELETSEERYRKDHMLFWESLPLFENVDNNILRDEL